ncbi:MAG: acyl carrier protein [Clostridiales bacterium]|jgi:acyl carrier protein|nr:acyl carrier protein [Clostridiales bacterium]
MTFERAAKLIAKNRDIDVSEIKEETTFESLGFDSLDTVELIMEFEDEFGISIELEDNLKTVGDAVKLIDSKL